MRNANGLLIIGVLLVVAGLLGFAVPLFTTQSTDTVARIGDLKIQATEDTSHRIPQPVSGGVLVLGLILVASSLYRRR